MLGGICFKNACLNSINSVLCICADFAIQYKRYLLIVLINWLFCFTLRGSVFYIKWYDYNTNVCDFSNFMVRVLAVI